MTDRELIKWIQDNHAEDLSVLIEHRDSGGSYCTAERLGEFHDPSLVDFKNEMYGIIHTVGFVSDNPTAILL